ncbi:transient receptor potential cation channel subfamily A member 1-like [Diadema antillarum]|uniref:transient receptor potential cation channel subfamily A member 1-like n=1 Tax=Diadema antillarum TaxID=105358 RepID=UPI003A8A0E2C
MSKKRYNPMNFFQELAESRDVNKQRALDKALVDACLGNDDDAVIDLLQKGASPEGEVYAVAQAMSGENFRRPLMAAVINGNKKMAQLLIENGADTSGKDKYGVQAIHCAAQSGHRDCVRLLLDAGASANAETGDFNKIGVYQKPFRRGTTPLHMAAKLNHVGCIEELVEHGRADVNQRDVIGMSCLNTACKLGHEESILTILRLSEGQKLGTGMTIGTGNTPLHDCVRWGLLEATKALLRRGADVNRPNPTGYTPLHFALIQTDSTAQDITEALILHSQGVDLNLPMGKGSLRPLHFVAFEPDRATHIHIHTIEYRMSNDHITCDPGRPHRDPALARFLIAYGADFEVEYHGVSLLQQEIYSQSDDTVLDAILAVTHSFEIPNQPEQVSFARAAEVGAEKRVARLREFFRAPRTLQHQCHLLIRRLLTPRRLNRLNELRLPEKLKDYILLRS